jgi:uncharacterized protein (DUF1778 family)
MSLVTQLKSERINLRLEQSVKSLLERAASFEGKTISKFILNSALTHAQETISKHETMLLNTKDSNAFIDALSQPVQHNSYLLEAIKEHDKRTTLT